MNKHPLIPPKPPDDDDDDIGDRFDRARDIFSLSREEYRKKMEEWLKVLVKGVPAFKKVAEIVKSQYEEFKAYAITAGIKQRERHMIAELSSSLKNYMFLLNRYTMMNLKKNTYTEFLFQPLPKF